MFVGLLLVDMPLSLGKLPFASRMLVIPWAKAGVVERRMIRRAVFIFILLPMSRVPLVLTCFRQHFPAQWVDFDGLANALHGEEHHL